MISTVVILLYFSKAAYEKNLRRNPAEGILLRHFSNAVTLAVMPSDSIYIGGKNAAPKL